MRRALAITACGAAALAGCGSDEPVRVAVPVGVDAAFLAPAFAKAARAARAAEQRRLESGDLDALLARAQGDPRLRLRLPRLQRDGLTATDVAVRTNGRAVAAEGTVDPDQLGSLAPGGVSLHYAGGLTLKGKAKRFGVSVPVTLKIAVDDGAVVAKPQNLPIGDVTLFQDPRVRVTGLRANPAPGGQVRLRAVGQLTG